MLKATHFICECFNCGKEWYRKRKEHYQRCTHCDAIHYGIIGLWDNWLQERVEQL